VVDVKLKKKQRLICCVSIFLIVLTEQSKEISQTHNATLKYNISSQLHFNLSNREEKKRKDPDCDDWNMCGMIYNN
jgi:hypothetical protein